MLQHLYIQNYALIESLELDFKEGFTVITGETGAGKSILLGALNLILGHRADKNVLMDTAKKCVVEATFDIKDYNLISFFNSNDLDYDDHTIVRREINASGKSRAFINDTPVNLNLIKSLGERMINIHSQDDQISLGDSIFQMAVVDSYAGIIDLKLQYGEQFKQFVELQKTLNSLIENQKQACKEKDYLQFLFDELEAAKLEEGEQERLESEQEMLKHTEEIKGILFQAGQNLNDENNGILQQLSTLQSNLEKISGYGESLAELANRISSANIELSDTAGEIEKLEESVSHNPARVEEINERLDLLYNLQTKHRVNEMQALLEKRDEIQQKLGSIENRDAAIEDAEKNLRESKEKIVELANRLSEKREAVFSGIQQAVENTLKQLGIPFARFVLENNKNEKPGINGFDRIVFLFNANKGLALQDVAKVASGGEKSRLMLAIKSLISQKSLLPTIIFDEIDAGVSGAVAEKTGQILSNLSKTMQVLAITHLPQIAGLGNDHLMVYKDSSDKITRTKIRRLSADDRIIEIAKLLSGHEITDASVESARHLLKN